MKLNHNQHQVKIETTYQDINNYIDNLDKNLEPTEQLLLITSYIQENDYELTIDKYVSLVQNNQILIKILEIII